jgi:hypothetical protein
VRIVDQSVVGEGGHDGVLVAGVDGGDVLGHHGVDGSFVKGRGLGNADSFYGLRSR